MSTQSVALFRKKHPIANQLHLTLLFEKLSSGNRVPRKGDIGDIVLRCDAFSDAYFDSLEESDCASHFETAFETEQDMRADDEHFTMNRLDDIARNAPRRKGDIMDVTVDLEYDADALYLERLNDNADLSIGGTGDCLEYRAAFLKSGKTSISATLRLGHMPLFSRKFNFEVKRSEEEIAEAKEERSRAREIEGRRAAFRLV